MTPHEFLECLAYVNWTPEQLADLLECDVGLVRAWATSQEDIPISLTAWIRTLATCHYAAGVPITWKHKKHKPKPK